VYQLDLNLTSSTLTPNIAQWKHERTASARWAQLGGRVTLNRRERLPAARYLFDASVPDRPAWLDIARAPARWREANRLVADIAREIAEGAGHELYSKAHTDLEIALIELLVDRRNALAERRHVARIATSRSQTTTYR
jgi:hypothetical protein